MYRVTEIITRYKSRLIYSKKKKDYTFSQLNEIKITQETHKQEAIALNHLLVTSHLRNKGVIKTH